MRAEIIKRLSDSFQQDDPDAQVNIHADSLGLTPRESELFKNFRDLSATKQQALLGFLLTRLDLGQA